MMNGRISIQASGMSVCTCETMPEMSPEFDGSSIVLVSLARLENAAMYCSATLMDTAFSPCC